MQIVARLGTGALLAKLDVKSAFRICPVRRQDWHLLGFSFQGMFFVDLCLPFGLRSSANRFSQLANAKLWILQNNYAITNSTNYLDDYFIAGPAGSVKCHQDVDQAISVFATLGIPLAQEKITRLRTVVTYLGIVIDTIKMELCLPDDKLQDLQELLNSYKLCKKVSKRRLLSLIGKLAFASKLIPSGRTFLRRIIDLSTSVKQLYHHVTLNSHAMEDIKWCLTFLPLWNGKQKILDFNVTCSPDLNLFIDASGVSGFGIYFNGRWVAQHWPPCLSTKSIQWK